MSSSTSTSDTKNAGYVAALISSWSMSNNENVGRRPSSSSCHLGSNVAAVLLVLLLVATPQLSDANTCFPDRDTLKSAVDSFVTGCWELSDGSFTYGEEPSEWCTRLVTDMSDLFFNSGSGGDVNMASFNEDLSRWDVSSVTTMRQMFAGAIRFSGEGIGSWDVSKVTDMNLMFSGVTQFSGEGIESWDVSKVTDMNRMFIGATQFSEEGIGSWDVSSVIDMNGMFSRASSFIGEGIGSWDVSKVTDMRGMFYLASSFIGEGIGSWDVSNVTDMSYMFSQASSFVGEGIESWDVSKVTDMSFMFSQASSFNENLCPWKERNFPYANANQIFDASGCNFTNTPNQANGGPFCADDCPAQPPPPPPSPSSKASKSPRSKSSKSPKADANVLIQELRSSGSAVDDMSHLFGVTMSLIVAFGVIYY